MTETNKTVIVLESEDMPLIDVVLSGSEPIKAGAILYNPRINDLRKATICQWMLKVGVELNCGGTKSLPWLKGDNICVLNPGDEPQGVGEQ